ncbi:hypothetical protein AB1Y20_022184 [Prymnesium parvum]|uniref:Peroxidase n=1 Tax=Prymnesium parvum TaxID=97485 RepID=A0AB34JG39_PRYPA
MRSHDVWLCSLALLGHQQVACVTTDVRGAPLEFPVSLSSTETELFVDITIARYLYHGPNGFKQYTRGFNGELTGPTIHVKPGDTLHVHFRNSLSEEGFETKHLHNTYKDIDTSNIHTHGLHVDGLPPGDSVETSILPGQTYDYTFEIPKNHQGGTFWYHPHHHGATALHTGGGAAGLLIVDDAPNTLPPEVAELENINLMLSHIKSATLKLIAGTYVQNCLNEGGSATDCDEGTWSNDPIGGNPVNFIAVNGMHSPNISLAANRWYRFRLAFISVHAVIQPHIDGCELKLLAKDGIYLHTAPRDFQTAFLGPGNRADWLIRCPVGSFTILAAARRRRLQVGNSPEMDTHIAYIEATDEGDVPCDLPTFEVNRPCYLVDLRGAVPDKTISFQLGPTPNINGETFHSATHFMDTLPVGKVIQYSLSGLVLHPFHNHINSFQIIEDPADTFDGYFRAGDWHDILISPNYKTDVRLQTDVFVGPQLFHCHDLIHEDLGMMGYTNITGTKGTTFPGAEDIDPTCYRGLTVGPPKIVSAGTCGAPTSNPPSSTPSSAGGDVTTLCFKADCKLVISFRESSSVADHVEFTLRFQGNTWLGIGVSSSGRMGAGAIGIITTWHDVVASHVYSLNGRTADAIKSGWVGVANLESATREGGVSSVVVNVPYSDSCDTNELVICRNGPTNIIVAHGYGDVFGTHPGQARFKMDGGQVTVLDMVLEWDMILHVVCMCIAWLFCAPLALALARLRHLEYFKPLLTRTRFKGGRQYWYLLHRNCLFATVSLTVGAGVFMTSRVDAHFLNPHSSAGIATMVVAFFQMANGLLRPKPGRRVRSSWVWLHRVLGVAICILAIVSGALGVSLLSRRLAKDYELVALVVESDSHASWTPPPPAVRPPPPLPRVASPVHSPPPPRPPPPVSIADSVQAAAWAIEDVFLTDPSAGPAFIRLAWLDAGTYDSTTRQYGPRASMRFEPEASHPSNNGLQHARELLEPIKQAVPSISYADLWQLAAVVSIEMMGGPRVPFRVGRVDASGPEECAPAGLLPGAHDTSEQLRAVFYRMGFEDGEIVALAGAHSVGICRLRTSGFRGPWDRTSNRFDNAYYQDLLNRSRWEYDGTQFNSVTGDGTMMLAADFRLAIDSGFATWTRLFARDELLWFQMFTQSFQKLGELGHDVGGLVPVTYQLKSTNSGQLGATIQKAATLVQEVVRNTRAGPAFVRLAWNDAATYNATDGKFGPRASMRFEPEASHPSNKGLQYARELLEPIKQAVPLISYADLWQLAAVVSIEMMGGPKIPFRMGRVDASGPEECAPAGLLPGAHDTAEQLRRVFYRMGFEPDHLVALMGAHTLGRCHPQYSGFNGPWTSDPLSFDNQYFKDLLNKQWAQTGDIYTTALLEDTIMLPSDHLLASDHQFALWADAYAHDESLFFSSFSLAFEKLGELGHSSLREATYTLTPIAPEQPQPERNFVCLKRNGQACAIALRWEYHRDDGTMTVALQVASIVGWLALGVSQAGRMTLPQPSKAVVGDSSGVLKRTLQKQDITSAHSTAPEDSVQDLRESSFERANGFTTLRFRVDFGWLMHYANLTSRTVHFIYAHGAIGDDVAALGYHANKRGNLEVSSFGPRRFVVTQEVLAQVQTATDMIARKVSNNHAGPALVRLAWQDAGTYTAADGTFGPRASMRFEPEASNPSNKGLQYARELLEPIKQAVPLISYADLWQLAAVVSIEMMGGPRVPFRMGRVDASGPEECAPAGLLPGAHDTAEQLRAVFYRMGFNDLEIVALMGAHTLGRCHPQYSGFNGPWTSDPLSFDNQYYVSMLNNSFSYSGSQWDADGLMMLNADMALKTDPEFRVYADLFATNQAAFFRNFSSAFSKLGELGWTLLEPVSYSIPKLHSNETVVANATIKQEVELKTGMKLSWTFHEDGNVSATVTLGATVGWLALGVSQDGRMVHQTPSYTVVGTDEGVQKRRLMSQDAANVSLSAPLEEAQDLHAASFDRADGAPSPITTVPPSIAPPPPASTQSLSIKSNLHLAWAHKSDATTTLTLRLDAHVQWLALAVSAAGKMIAPQPSRAVVGTVAGGVRKRTLQAQDPTSVSSSAPLDAVQDLTDSSLTHENGATVLTFTVTQSFLTQFSDEGTTVNFIYAHGEPNFLTGSFGYHGLQRRGAVQVLDFIPGGSGGGGSVIFPPPPPSPPRLPSSRAPVELTPRAGVRLLVTPLESSGVSVELVVQQQVPWLSVAVSHSGWMSEPEPSKAVVGDLVSSGVTSYDLKYQSPASPVQSVVRDNDMTWVNNTSLFFADGATTLRFRASVSWLSFYLDQVSISRADLFPPPPPSSSPPPPVPAPVSGSPPAGSGCSGSDPITDYCEESLSYQVARCYVSTSSLTAPQFDDAASAYEHSKQLSTEFRIAWTVKGDYPDGEISIMMQARTTGWIGFGIMADTANGASASGNGMIRSDIYIGAVVDGVATVLDAWSPSVAAPLGDAQSGHADDVYNVGGTEDAVQGLTTIWFTRKLATNDTWDYDIRAGFSIPVIFAYSRKNIDSFTHYHGPTRDFNKVVFIPVPPQDDPTITIVGAIVGVVVVLVLCLFDRKRRNQLASMEATRINVLRKEIDASIGSAGTLAYGISLINAHDFLRHKRILPFEALRDLNLLKAFDSTTEARAFAQSNTVLFLSYQWLGWDDPDPSGVHFRCISAAVRNIMSRASASMEETWLWIDHSCLPQLNRTTLSLAVSDLSEIASIATFFVVIAPPTVHHDTDTICDIMSYQSRGWCRLHQFAYVCTGKTDSMLVSYGSGTGTFTPYISLPTQWKQQALGILQGGFSCCERTQNHATGDLPCDKETLKPALLRMYLKAICHLPPCPLRRQLMERDRQIFPENDFSDDILKLAREKFNELAEPDNDLGAKPIEKMSRLVLVKRSGSRGSKNTSNECPQTSREFVSDGLLDRDNEKARLRSVLMLPARSSAPCDSTNANNDSTNASAWVALSNASAFRENLLAPNEVPQLSSMTAGDAACGSLHIGNVPEEVVLSCSSIPQITTNAMSTNQEAHAPSPRSSETAGPVPPGVPTWDEGRTDSSSTSTSTASSNIQPASVSAALGRARASRDALDV